jgi:hypothetical protein
LKLKINESSVIEVESGIVSVEGGCAVLRELAEQGFMPIVVAYCLKPGEKLRRISEEEYAVEY